MDIKKEYERWLANATADGDVLAELKTLDDAKIEDAFYRDLAFGTGGLRGVIGAGTNRMNIYTVAKASQGLADYLKKNYEKPSVVIGYDSRIKSDVFAKVAAGVFAANGVKVNIWPVLMPVPTVSFATRYLHTSAGVMVTASHNPSKYNGYKVYGADGCQITTEAAAEILAEIEKLNIFVDVKTSDFEAGVASGSIRYIPDEVYTAFVEQVKSQSVLFGEEVNKDVAIVYSPLNGTGLKPVTRTLKEMGYTNITVVKEQERPDGNFPTCPYPNPEIKEAMALGMEYAKKCNADLLLATDPDCDRVGIAVKNKAGEYELLTGNQTGMLVYFNNSFEAAVFFPLFREKKTIVHIHDMVDMFRPAHKKCVLESCENAEHILTASDACRKMLIKNGIDSSKVSTAYNSIAIGKRDYVQNDSDNITIGFVGSAIKRKGFDVYINIINTLKRQDTLRGKQIKSIVITNSKKKDAFLEDCLSRLDRDIACNVYYGIPREQVFSQYKMMDLLLVPSRFDPLPTVVLEASLEGVPVIGTDKDGIPEMQVDEDMLFNVDDIADAIRKIEKWFNLPFIARKEKMDKAQAYIEYTFTAAKKKDVVLNSIRDVLEM